MGLGSVAWVIGAEMFEQRARPKASYLAGVVTYICTFATLLAFQPLEDIMHAYVFLIFAAIVLCSLIFISTSMPETKNRSFMEIAREMSHRKKSYVAPT
jgi:MFS transporter, SP family, solute carrier family 2 (facilitated glucose transporter), member 11